MSHPVWVRGLKRFRVLQVFKQQRVAPRVGAWIETCSSSLNDDGYESHPVWVRGLKLTLHYANWKKDYVAPRVGAWIETYGH